MEAKFWIAQKSGEIGGLSLEGESWGIVLKIWILETKSRVYTLTLLALEQMITLKQPLLVIIPCM